MVTASGSRGSATYRLKNKRQYLGGMVPLIMLHGALGAADQLAALKDSFAESRHILTPDFSGHGNAAAADTFSIPLFAQDILMLMDEAGIDQADIFGYSMGGYIGLYLAQQYPPRIRKTAALGTKYFWDAAYAGEQIKSLDPEKILAKIPHFAEALATRHAGKDWKDILQKTAAMMTALGSAETLPLSKPGSISNPVLLMVGDRDNTVSISETEGMRGLLPNAQLAVLPATPHPFEKVPLSLLSLLLKNFYG